MRTFFVSVLAAFAVVVLAALPAAARVHHPAVFIDDEHGILTTPCVVHPGEVLHGAGYVTGTFTVTSVTPHGPVFLVTLSPAPAAPQSSEVLGFTS
ncbi:MAG TPA: hypothetical protein VGS06_46285 [Streptosporangiaceae bacterium]|nr:hypothetical protein [Streptosporangiaceae bacterium]